MRAEFESWLHNQWSVRRTLAWLLSPLSLIYLSIVKSRARNADPVKLPVPVVVVGNIYVGGTGKTPVTIELVKALKAMGYHPGVISRGFGRKNSLPQIVTADSPAHLVGDEPLLIAQQTKVPAAVSRDRAAAGLLLLKEHPEINVIVSDDGLQHLRLARDIELAVVGARGIGNGWVLPAGPLREPPSRLDSVDAIVLNATTDTIASRTPRFAATSQIGMAHRLCDGCSIHIDDLADRINKSHAKVLAAAGIASPERFFAMLRAHDINCSELKLGDHFSYDSNPFAKWSGEYIVVTGKDAVKCRQKPELSQDPRIWTVDLEMHLDPYLIELVLNKLADKPVGELPHSDFS